MNLTIVGHSPEWRQRQRQRQRLIARTHDEDRVVTDKKLGAHSTATQICTLCVLIGTVITSMKRTASLNLQTCLFSSVLPLYLTIFKLSLR